MYYLIELDGGRRVVNNFVRTDLVAMRCDFKILKKYKWLEDVVDAMPDSKDRLKEAIKLVDCGICSIDK